MDKLKRNIKQVKANAVNLTVGPNDGHTRSKEKSAGIAEQAKLHNANRSPERLRKNGMLAVQYRMEQYAGDDQVTYENIYAIEDFVNDFLKVLGINKGTFAAFIEMGSSNLNKYYKNERRFTLSLALKFAHFFHTPIDLWLRVQMKNDLLKLEREKELDEKYSKYDYEKLLQIA